MEKEGAGGIKRSRVDAQASSRCVVQYMRGTNVEHASYQRCEHEGGGGGAGGADSAQLAPRGESGGIGLSGAQGTSRRGHGGRA
eukprot:2999143-Pyramimonas_sp.AAC.1